MSTSNKIIIAPTWFYAMLFTVLAFLVSLSTGCQVEGVGDPCTPERVEEGGFKSSESYVETSSVQCRTRVCMVYHLEGDPRENCTENCASEQEIAERVYCTCRCGGPPGVTAKFCDCPDGFRCEEIFNEGDSPGLIGSYCVNNSTPRAGEL